MSASVDSSPRVVAAFVAPRHGVVGRSKLRALGLSDEKIDRWVAAGRLHRLYRGVYFYGPTNPPASSWAAAALLACGPTAVLSHLSAAALHGLTGWPAEVHVTVPDRRCRPRSGLAPHAARLAPEEVRAKEGLRVTVPARTLDDLSSLLDPATLERVTNEAEVRRLVPRRHGAMPSRNDAER